MSWVGGTGLVMWCWEGRWEEGGELLDARLLVLVWYARLLSQSSASAEEASELRHASRLYPVNSSDQLNRTGVGPVHMLYHHNTSGRLIIQCIERMCEDST